MKISACIAICFMTFAIGVWSGEYLGTQRGFHIGKQYGFDLGHAYGVNHCSQDGDPGCRKWLDQAKRTLAEPEIFSAPFFGKIERRL